MQTYLVKVEYKTPRGSHMTYEIKQSAKTKAEALCNAFNHLMISGKKNIDRGLRMEAQPIGEQ